MNALGALALLDATAAYGIHAAGPSASPAPATAAAATKPENVPFLNLINALFSTASEPDEEVSSNAYQEVPSNSKTAPASPTSSSSPKQIADALIRSMFSQSAAAMPVARKASPNAADATPLEEQQIAPHASPNISMPLTIGSDSQTAPAVPVSPAIPEVQNPSPLASPTVETPDMQLAQIAEANLAPALRAKLQTGQPHVVQHVNQQVDQQVNPQADPQQTSPVPDSSPEPPVLPLAIELPALSPDAGKEAALSISLPTARQTGATSATAFMQGTAQTTTPGVKAGPARSDKPLPLAFAALLTKKDETPDSPDAASSEEPANENENFVKAPPSAASEMALRSSKQAGPGSMQPPPERSLEPSQSDPPPENQPQAPASSPSPAASSPEPKLKSNAPDEDAPVANTAVVSNPREALSQMTAAPIAPARASGSTGTAPDTETRTADPAEPAPLPQPAQSNSIAVRITNPGESSVDLQIVDRAGELHVAVRTPDAGLQTSLRADLGTLVNNLDRSGFGAEVFAPREVTLAAAAFSGSAMNSQSGDRDAPHSGTGNPGQNSPGGRQPKNQDQANPEQRQKRIEAWMEELENS